MTIHETLRQLRQASGLTQEQVVQQIGLTRQALSSYESGRTRPDIETLMALAEIYGTDLEGLLYGQEKQQKAAHRGHHLAVGLIICIAQPPGGQDRQRQQPQCQQNMECAIGRRLYHRPGSPL